MKKYIFGYGSLMNVRSLQKTVPGARISQWVGLIGYKRKVNAPDGKYLYLNIVPRARSVVRGALIPISPTQIRSLKKREVGYQLVDITEKLMKAIGGRAYAFIAPDKKFRNKKILQSYILTCLRGIPKKERVRWLSDTIIENEIENDTTWPKYENIA